jgi:hypothetical protein
MDAWGARKGFWVAEVGKVAVRLWVCRLCLNQFVELTLQKLES